MNTSCFETCTREDCHAGAPCHKPVRRVRAGAVQDAQASDWVEIDPAPGEIVVNGRPELPIDFAEPEPGPIDGWWFGWVLVAVVAFWGLIYLGVVA